jgi:H+/Cl- antiporter ClcA
MSRLPGFNLTAAVAVGMGASTAAVLRLPLSGVVVATLLTAKSGPGSGPLVIVGVVVAYLIVVALDPRDQQPAAAEPASEEPARVESSPAVARP